jgi:hypothetical protein
LVVGGGDFLDVVGICSVCLGLRLITTIKAYVDFVAGINSTAVLTLGDVKLGLKGFVLSTAFFKTTNRFTISMGELLVYIFLFNYFQPKRRPSH